MEEKRGQMLKRVNCVLVALVFSFILLFGDLVFLNGESVQAARPASVKTFKINAGTKYKKEKIAVKYKSASAEKSFKNKLKKYGTSELKRYKRSNVSIIPVPKGKTVESYINELLNDSDVLYAQPIYEYERKYQPNDTYYNNQWYLSKIKAPQAWDLTKGSSSIKVAVIDGAVDVNHPDLSGNIAGSYSVTSWFDGYDEHATHVAGIIAGAINNSKGISGVAPYSKILSINVFQGDSADDTDVAEAIIYAVDSGARVINLSLGGPGYSYTLKEAVDYAYSKGAVLIAASGNDNIYYPYYPAAFENVVSVSATDRYDYITYFSNYGSTIDIAAPGEDVFSTVLSNSYDYMDGTSMASPIVSGVAALILSKAPSLTNAQVTNILLNSATDIGSTGVDYYYGHGLVDAYKAVTTAASAGASINSLTIQPSSFVLTGTSVSTISYNLSYSAAVSIKVLNSSGQLVKQLATSKSSVSGNNTITWDGKDSSGKYVLPGTYSVQVEITGVYGGTKKSASFTVVDKIKPVISSVSASGYFSPKGTNTWKLSYSLSEQGKTTVVIKDSLGRDVKTLASNVSQQVGTNSLVWDGKNSSGALVPNGSYSYRITSTDSYGNVSNTYQGTVNIDTLIPIVSQISDSPDAFLPSGTNNVTFSFNLSEKSKVTIKIYSPTGALFRDLAVNQEYAAGLNKVLWDGKDKSGKFGIDGYYQYTVIAVDFAGNSSVAQGGQLRIDANVPSITGISDTPDPAIPNGKNYSTIYYNISEQSKVTAAVYNSSGVLQKTLLSSASVSGGAQSIKWDYKNSKNALVSDGIYTYKISAVDSFNKKSAVYQGTITIDRVVPALSLSSSSAFQFNFTGSNISNFVFNLSENAKTTLKIMKTDGTVVRYVLNNTAKNKGANTVAWDGKDQSGNALKNGSYKFELYATDYAGNKSSSKTGTITYKDLWLPILNSDTSYYLSTQVASEVGVSYTLSKGSNVTIDILDSKGTVIKNVVNNVLKNKGTNSFSWNGKNSSNVLQPNGTYVYRINAKDSNGNAAQSLTGKIIIDNSAPGISGVSVLSSYYPQKLDFKFTISEAAQVTIIVYSRYDSTSIPTVVKNQYMNSGSYTVTWTGYNYYYSYNYNIIIRDKAGNTTARVGTIY